MNLRPGNLPKFFVCHSLRAGFFDVLPTIGFATIGDAAIGFAMNELGALDEGAGWDGEAWQQALAAYWQEHDVLLTDADARGPQLLMIDTEAEPGIWRVRQILHDPAGDHDWAIGANVDRSGPLRRRRWSRG